MFRELCKVPQPTHNPCLQGPIDKHKTDKFNRMWSEISPGWTKAMKRNMHPTWDSGKASQRTLKGISQERKPQPHRQENQMDKGMESGYEGKHRQLMVLLEIEEDGKGGEIRQGGHVCDGSEVCFLDRSLQLEEMSTCHTVFIMRTRQLYERRYELGKNPGSE